MVMTHCASGTNRIEAVAASSPSSLSLEESAAAISLPPLITRRTHSSQSGLRNLRHHAGSEEARRDTG